ncbi:glycosyltransferase family 4 protein [Armatimonas sp.]|uniref:glycosyltransferase family 4 protein n=1 Tax=Armatimonas sp. TaxID=1872638 RepID=UPI00286AE65D|nr:glycosyltransferase family 4 protein [Armatimonas sp.]
MKIAVVTHNVIKGDGQGRANLEIVRYAKKQGAEVTLFADRVDPALVAEGIEWVKIQPRIRSNWLVHGIEFLLKANQLIEKRRHEFDIIHGYGGSFTINQDINTSQFVHSAWMKNQMHPAKQTKGFYRAYQFTYSKFNSVIERKSYNSSRFIVPASSTVQSELNQDLGIPLSKMKVILNGADPLEFYPGNVDRATLGLPVAVSLALFAGDIRTGRKNLDSVLKALVKVPKLHLAIVGRKAESPFPELAQQLGIESRCHFLDFRTDIAAIMRACDFFVFPSRYEACALVLVEALTSGLPIITTETTGGAEVVGESAGVCLKDTEDVDALAEAMGRFASDPVRLKEMSVAARAHSAQYTWEKIASTYYALYQELAESKSVRKR